jgi:hypothetical protein
MEAPISFFAPLPLQALIEGAVVAACFGLPALSALLSPDQAYAPDTAPQPLLLRELYFI